jgi:DNA mismatch endonuclease (patch repair protein)
MKQKPRKPRAISYPEPSEQRRQLMARVKSRDTIPELKVRRLLHAMGYRFRLHRRDLPGTPDIVLGPKRKAIFVHGCFWHRHKGCRKTTTPTMRREFWLAKFNANVERDRRSMAELKKDGWDVLIIWECESTSDSLADRLRRFVRSDPTKTKGSTRCA